jgi:hypothetical protein
MTMARTCRFSLGSLSGLAEWSFDEASLVVTPHEGSPLVYAVREMSGVAGDGYTLQLAVPGAAVPGPGGAGGAGGAAGAVDELLLSHLGAEGPTLLESLRERWLAARAKALRLGGSGEGKPFSGWVADSGDAGSVASSAGWIPEPGGGPRRPGGGRGGGAAPAGPPEPFQGMLFEDVLLLAREGRDIEPLFLGLTENVEFDEAAYAVRVREWPGREVVFSKLARQTEEFLGELREARSLLAEEAAATLAAALPTVAPGPRGVLAGKWLPGRLLTLEEMEALCPGFEGSFRGQWLTQLPRREEGEYLLSWATPGSSWLGCSRDSLAWGGGSDSPDEGEEPGVTAAPAGAAPAGAAASATIAPAGAAPAGAAAAEAAAAEAAAPSRSAAPPNGRVLWLLSGKRGAWFLEALSTGDRATYHYAGGDELPALVSRLLCAPQFSREALYSPLGALTGERADLAIAAQFLGFLAQLRECFRSRVIHRSAGDWLEEMKSVT